MSHKKFVLGTVQLGMPYGINNTHGQPSHDEAFKILDDAHRAGINLFDTAHAYGTSEDVLGAWIKERSLVGSARVTSKLKPHVLNEYPDGTPARDIIRTEIEKSLKRLGLPKLDGYLLHTPHYIYLKHVVEGLRAAKESGLVSNIGVSTYDEAEALQAAELGVDYIQVPYNVFDQRLDKTNFFELAHKNNVKIFARSPYLQGLLFMEPQTLPQHLAYLRPYLEQFREIAKRHGLSLLGAAISFVRSACRSEYIVLGVETPEQLQEVLRFETFEVPDAFTQDIRTAFNDMNRGAINPSLWTKVRI